MNMVSFPRLGLLGEKKNQSNNSAKSIGSETVVPSSSSQIHSPNTLAETEVRVKR